MPTGYTDAIKDGISFEKFAMTCARAMGACVTLRDEPFGADQIPEEFQPSPYHAEKLADARKKLTRLLEMTIEQAESESRKEYQEKVDHRQKMIAEKKGLEGKYKAMLAKVRSYIPPTSEHIGFKEFMEKQIVESIDWDCGTTYYEQPIDLMSGSRWLDSKIDEARNDIAYHTKHYAEEVERARSRTEWIKQLRESLETRELHTA